MNVTIEVTQDDIDKGEPGNPCACPIWWALHRAFPALPMFVGTAVIRCDHAGSHAPVFARLPQSARDFIARLDTAHSVEPFSFDLDVPDDLMAGAA